MFCRWYHHVDLYVPVLAQSRLHFLRSAVWSWQWSDHRSNLHLTNRSLLPIFPPQEDAYQYRHHCCKWYRDSDIHTNSVKLHESEQLKCSYSRCQPILRQRNSYAISRLSSHTEWCHSCLRFRWGIALIRIPIQPVIECETGDCQSGSARQPGKTYGFGVRVGYRRKEGKSEESLRKYELLNGVYGWI